MKNAQAKKKSTSRSEMVTVNVWSPGDRKPWASFDVPKAIPEAWDAYAKDQGISHDESFERALSRLFRQSSS